ncbi:MAG: hypothetical protein ACK5NC_04665 [Vibrio sp.]
MKFISQSERSHGIEFAQELKVFLDEHQEEYGKTLIPNLDHLDNFALNEHGIVVKEVNHLTDNRYSLVYDYDWFIFSGCTDTDESGVETNKVTVTIQDNGDIEFDRSALGRND